MGRKDLTLPSRHGHRHTPPHPPPSSSIRSVYGSYVLVGYSDVTLGSQLSQITCVMTRSCTSLRTQIVSLKVIIALLSCLLSVLLVSLVRPRIFIKVSHVLSLHPHTCAISQPLEPMSLGVPPPWFRAGLAALETHRVTASPGSRAWAPFPSSWGTRPPPRSAVASLPPGSRGFFLLVFLLRFVEARCPVMSPKEEGWLLFLEGAHLKRSLFHASMWLII